MRISKIVLIVLVSILSLTLLAQGILAAQESNATITFMEDTAPSPILDPDDGSIPDPDNLGAEDGPLSLDYVTNLNFGSHIFSLETKTYNASTLKPFVQVTDKRDTPTGWDVTVSATAFKSASLDTLEGAYFEFRNGETLSNLGLMYAPPKTTPFRLYTDSSAVKFVYANPNEGRGSWITRWYPSTEMATNDNVTLTVYGGTMKEEVYNSTLTWTLTDAP